MPSMRHPGRFLFPGVRRPWRDRIEGIMIRKALGELPPLIPGRELSDNHHRHTPSRGFAGVAFPGRQYRPGNATRAILPRMAGRPDLSASCAVIRAFR